MVKVGIGMAMTLTMPITILKGIGEKRASDYSRLGINTIKDMIEFYPRTYEVSMGFSRINEVNDSGTFLVRGTICATTTTRRAGRLMMTSTVIRDRTGEIGVTWFNQAYLKKHLSMGREIILKGKVVYKYNKLQFTSPKLMNQKDLEYFSDHSVLPIYPISKGVSQRTIRLTIAEAIKHAGDEIRDFLPSEIKAKYDLADLDFALNQVHYPDGEASLERGRRRLIFDEFLLFQLGLMSLKEDQVKIENQFDFTKCERYDKMRQSLPYSLTGAQVKVMDEILVDLRSPYNMNRLIQGDVGSGKTIISAMAMMLAVENGYQAALMAPTEVLAKQHFISLKEAFNGLNVRVGLLVGSMTKKQKLDVYYLLEEGLIDLVIGTHAVIQEGVRFNQLALVITDEQHRFGVKQREVLAGKGHYPHVLVMSATPIPRTLALILYGDMDVSIIDEMPPGRQEIDTYSVNTTYRERIQQFMLKEVDAGRQCYVVCPKVEESEEDELADVISYSKELGDVMPSHVVVEYLHGKMRPKEKNAIMQRFVEGEIHILVSTTVIEVGINVPNATVMLIENAERFGLAQLHQLRGRVGRGQHKSYCVLMTDAKTSNTKKRMQVMTDSTDGFVIAEKDLELRGHGDLLGLRQSGVPAFKIANIMEDAKTLKEASEVARMLRDHQEILLEEDYKYLNKRIRTYIEEYMSYIAL